MKKLTLVSLLFFISLFTHAQEFIFKESKTAEFNSWTQNGDVLLINGERTFLNLYSWDKDEVKVESTVISRYKEQNQAQADLEKISVNLNKKGKKIYYNNTIKIKNANDKPLSNLKVELTIYAPAYMIIDIKNSFGKINIEGSYKEILLQSKFSDIKISGVIDQTEVNTKYGDTNISAFSGNISLTGDRSNIYLNDIRGDLNLNIKFGEVEITPSNETIIKQFITEYAPITVFLTSDFSESLDVICKSCNIVNNSVLKNIFIDNENHLIVNKGKKSVGQIISSIEDIRLK